MTTRHNFVTTDTPGPHAAADSLPFSRFIDGFLMMLLSPTGEERVLRTSSDD